MPVNAYHVPSRHESRFKVKSPQVVQPDSRCPCPIHPAPDGGCPYAASDSNYQGTTSDSSCSRHSPSDRSYPGHPA